MPPIEGIEASSQMDRIDVQLAQLENAQLVRRLDEDDPAFRFKHALSQEAAYGTILRKKRAGLHRLVAAAYEQFYPAQLNEFALLLCQHWTEAGDQDRAAGYLVRAGDAAARLFAPVESRWHYTHALASLELLAASEDIIRRRIEATTRYAMVAFGSVPPDQILERLAAADLLAQKLSTGRPDRLLRAHLGSWIGRLHVITNRPLEGLEDFERVLSEARDLDEPDLLAVSSGEIGLVRVRLGQCGGAEALLKPAIVHYEQVANWQQWTYLLARLAMAEAAQGHVAVGFADGERMLSFANASHAIAVSNLFLA
jgi:hypothetical protein